MNHKHLNIFSIFGLIFIAFSMLIVFYWVFFQGDNVVMKDINQIKVDKKEYHSGDRIVYTFDYCKNYKSVATINRALVDTFRVTYTELKSDLPIGCHTVSVNDIIVPDFLKNDGHVYHLEGTTEYKLNPLRSQFIYWRTVDFIVN